MIVTPGCRLAFGCEVALIYPDVSYVCYSMKGRNLRDGCIVCCLLGLDAVLLGCLVHRKELASIRLALMGFVGERLTRGVWEGG